MRAFRSAPFSILFLTFALAGLAAGVCRAKSPGKQWRPRSAAASTPHATPAPTDPPPPATPESTDRKYYPDASISASELSEFPNQPPRVQALIRSALNLAEQNLTYLYGSDDPASGGMDCSGAIHYLLTNAGMQDVPRDSSGQYTWVRKNHLFYSVVSKHLGTFEFADLKPGDLLFWTGTYSVSRDPPITHTMLYLGTHAKRKTPIMWGSSDGRSYDGKARWGVSVFDLVLPRAETATNRSQAAFIGYGRIPGLRDPAPLPASPP